MVHHRFGSGEGLFAESWAPFGYGTLYLGGILQWSLCFGNYSRGLLFLSILEDTRRLLALQGTTDMLVAVLTVWGVGSLLHHLYEQSPQSSMPGYYMVDSQNRGPQCRPQYTIILIIGTPKMIPIILGNPQISKCKALAL